jgi:hypothetical protein
MPEAANWLGCLPGDTCMTESHPASTPSAPAYMTDRAQQCRPWRNAQQTRHPTSNRANHMVEALRKPTKSSCMYAGRSHAQRSATLLCLAKPCSPVRSQLINKRMHVHNQYCISLRAGAPPPTGMQRPPNNGQPLMRTHHTSQCCGLVCTKQKIFLSGSLPQCSMGAHPCSERHTVSTRKDFSHRLLHSKQSLNLPASQHSSTALTASVG